MRICLPLTRLSVLGVADTVVRRIGHSLTGIEMLQAERITRNIACFARYSYFDSVEDKWRGILATDVENFLDQHSGGLEKLAAAPTLNPAHVQQIVAPNLDEIIEDLPDKTIATTTRSEAWRSRKVRKIDFAEQDAANRYLAKDGTDNDLRCSEEIPQQYHLFRAFDFGREPRLYILHDSHWELCQLDPVLYRAVILHRSANSLSRPEEASIPEAPQPPLRAPAAQPGDAPKRTARKYVGVSARRTQLVGPGRIGIYSRAGGHDQDRLLAPRVNHHLTAQRCLWLRPLVIVYVMSLAPMEHCWGTGVRVRTGRDVNRDAAIHRTRCSGRRPFQASGGGAKKNRLPAGSDPSI